MVDKKKFCVDCREEITQQNMTNLTPYWCYSCNEIRMDRIEKQIYDVLTRFTEKGEGV